MPDVFSVTAAWDKPSYNAGDTMTATISGGDILTTTATTTATAGPVTIPIVAADGAQSTVTVPSVQVSTTTVTSTPQSVVIDTTKPIVDPGGRIWTVSANKLSVTALA